MHQRSKIAILGFGVEGRAVFEYLKKHDYEEMTICDQNVDLKDKMPDGVSVCLGVDYLENLEDFEVIFRSPGIRYFDPHIQAAVQKGVQLTSATKFFMDQCPCPIVGVTGTKGKGTTCTLIYEMLKKEGKTDIFLCGNIGKCPMEFLDDLKGDDLVILELSSFQLQDLKKSPRYAILLNTTIDHLDYHVDRDEYLQAKEKLLSNQNKNCVAVLNKDYEYSKYYIPLVKGKLKLVSVKEKVKDGAFVHNGVIFYVKNGKFEEVAKVSEVALIGSHNLENIVMAVVMAKELGAKTSAIHKVIKEFKNLPHRLQLVRELNGVKYFNDSASTIPETSMAAVDSFEEPTILIAGGYDKNSDYNEWAVKILTKPNLHTVILMGKEGSAKVPSQSAEKMEKALIDGEAKLGEAIGSPTKIIRRENLEDAVVAAYAEAEPGSVVVMSPGATSFDMFKNYKERGNEFIAQVRKLK